MFQKKTRLIIFSTKSNLQNQYVLTFYFSVFEIYTIILFVFIINMKLYNILINFGS